MPGGGGALAAGNLPAGLAAPADGRGLGQYLRLFRDRFFMGHVLTGALCMAGMFAYITGSPFVFIELYGVKPEHFGWLFGINAAGFILMAQVNVRLVRWRGRNSGCGAGCGSSSPVRWRCWQWRRRSLNRSGPC